MLFYSQPVGLILADTMELAVQAAKLVEVSYVETNTSFSMSSIARSLLNPILGQSNSRKYAKQFYYYNRDSTGELERIWVEPGSIK